MGDIQEWSSGSFICTVVCLFLDSTLSQRKLPLCGRKENKGLKHDEDEYVSAWGRTQHHFREWGENLAGC